MSVSSFRAVPKLSRAEQLLAKPRDRAHRAACAMNGLADLCRLSDPGRSNLDAAAARENLDGLFAPVGDYMMDIYTAVDLAILELEDGK